LRLNETEIIKQLQNGNQQAFRDLYDIYFDYAVRAATAIMNHNAAHASDAVQETFIRVFQNIHQYHIDRPFKSWFYKILLNECNRILKKNAKVISVGEVLEQQEEDYYSFVENEDLYEALQELDEINKIPIVLKYLNDLKEQEIAEILDENINTIKSRLYKGRQKLKHFLLTKREDKKNG
jgi:RNA polymerase sigma factor (sigma-70 family)